ncbi:MAG: glucose-1-phosphate adenylyltransferase [Thiobacillaceae bacterium]|nr:glucose-1-phosphate adenylyltransferase [Thiobacillaceae bacterium]MCX7673227.1 glucose-1-phosphate adenylyltransferase [Thiobacillaceae bacterium]MDW8323973.1 glucose-1-phosphate adenylyltransferase [Burkholderiales bacterium]
MRKLRILAMVMAGGEGSRLHPLTAERSKPSVPFGARYRIVDFVLSNLMNSGIHSIYLLVQYKSQSLIEHVRKAWVLPPILPEHFITVVPPQMRRGQSWFQGTADAVHQNLNLIRQHRPDLVAVFGADHIYRMDVRQMVQFHLDHAAAATVAALPVPIEQAHAFGVIEADARGRILAFQEKPVHPAHMPGDPTRAFASMGNYLFNAEVLEQALIEAHARGENDFGKHVLPRLVGQGLYAYDFAQNRVPGVRDYEEPAYWRDVGTLDAYYEAHMDVLGLTPRFDVFNAQWPIFSSNYQGPVAKFQDARLDNSIVSAGCLIHGARVRDSVLRREVVLEPGVELDGCIVMDNVTIRAGARLKRVIVDRYNIIEAGSRIGYDLRADAERYKVTEKGVVVIPEAQPYESVRTSFAEEG